MLRQILAPIHPDGWKFIAVAAVVTLILFILWPPAGWIALILTLWLPPVYSLLYDLVLPRMRGTTSSIYIIISTLLGLGMGPYFVGIVSDKLHGDLGHAIMSINVVAPVTLLCLVTVLFRINRDEATVLDRARAGGEEV